jgi:hypothetical protein
MHQAVSEGTSVRRVGCHTVATATVGRTRFDQYPAQQPPGPATSCGVVRTKEPRLNVAPDGVWQLNNAALLLIAWKRHHKYVGYRNFIHLPFFESLFFFHSWLKAEVYQSIMGKMLNFFAALYFCLLTSNASRLLQTGSLQTPSICRAVLSKYVFLVL